MHHIGMIRDLYFGGRAVRLDVTGADAADLTEFLFCQVPESGSAQPDVTVSLADCGADGEIRFKFPGADHPGKNDGGSILENANHQAGEVRGSASRIASKVLYEVDFHLANLASDGLYLHAASLARQGQAIILPASSGSGKSTLTCWLTQHGFQYMSDEATFVPLDSQICMGFTRPAVLKAGSLELLPDLGKQTKLELRKVDGRVYGWLIGVSALNALGMEQTPMIKSIVFPHFQSDADLEYEQLSSARTAFELAKCLINARNLSQNGFPEIMRLAQTVPAWRLVYGDVRWAQEFFDEHF
ncbi:MAG: hypothetical protein J7K66_04025 [Anaerolineaceae bacterium]|nr:hypothetical protein [Anaerolineaceae bacterium]